MMISFPLKTSLPPTIGVWRLFVAALGIAALAVAIYRAPVWLATWNTSAAVGAIGAAAILLVFAVGVALRGSAHVVKRVALEASLLAGTLIAVETTLLSRAPEKWSDDPLAQRIAAREQAALERGIPHDARLRSEVVRDLKAQGHDAVPGFAQSVLASPVVTAAIRERGLMPLSNVSGAHIVECSEGNDYFEFRSDEHGFNNPPGLVSGPVEVAVLGESFALGHCVPPSTSAVDVVRASFPRTANFAVAGSRVLSQLGVFREYVEPLEPLVVVWFVNVNFAEPRQESGQPLLMKYLSDPSFSQGLRQRQHEVDSFLRDVVIPLNLRRDEVLRAELEASDTFPLQRVIKLSEVRSLVELGAVTRPAVPAPDLSHFERAVDRVVAAVRGWGGSVILVILPSYALSAEQPQNIARYNALLNAIDPSAVRIVDGVALFAAEPDTLGLFTLRIDNHPSERGHAVIGNAVVAAIKSRGKP